MSNDSLPQIDYHDLIEALSDPDKDLGHFMQYMIEVPSFDRIEPELHPNPGLVRGIPPSLEGGFFLGAANSLMKGRRHRAYRNRLAEGWTGPRIVSEGDSWFQYPTSLLDIIDHLMTDHAILSMGGAGDRLIDIQRQREILINLRHERASALLLSAGGNDIFDKGKIGDLVEEPFLGATADDLVGATFKTFLREILGRYLEIFVRVHSALPHVHILTHGYANAFPSGDRWIERPLTKRGVPTGLQHDVVKRMVSLFNDGLVSLSKRSEFHGMIEHIDLTDLGTRPKDWHNEIHLNGSTAKKAAGRFREVLKQRLSSPAIETGIANGTSSPKSAAIVRQAETFAAFDDATLLDELDLRVTLLEMDPSAADDAIQEPSVLIGRAQTETGLRSLRVATRQLIRTWENNLRNLLCGDGDDTGFAKVVKDAVSKGKSALSGAIATWLISGPFGVPAALAGTLAAWLAGHVIDMGLAAICKNWSPPGPAPSLVGGAVPAEKKVTFKAIRDRMRTPEGDADLSKDGQKNRLDFLDRLVAKGVVENWDSGVDVEGAERFKMSTKEILERLGAEPDETEVPDHMLIATEAMIEVDGSRPSICVRDGFVDLNDPILEHGGWRDKIAAHEKEVRSLIKASGRIIQRSDRSADSVFGSAWMLEDGRVATARHVVEGMVDPEFDFKDKFYVDFSVEADRPMDPTRIFQIADVAWAGDEVINRTVRVDRIDAAVLTLVPKDGVAFPAPLPLLTADDGDDLALGKWLFCVGHPAAPRGGWLVEEDTGIDGTIVRAVVEKLVGNRFGVKRLAPGRVDAAPGFVEGDEATQHVFLHDATVFGGSSGSGIISLGKARMSGLHFAGKFETANYAHFVAPLAARWST